MKSKNKSSFFCPFENLRYLLKNAEGSSKSPLSRKYRNNNASALSPKHNPNDCDEKLFTKAMEGVVPINRKNIVEKRTRPYSAEATEPKDQRDTESIEKLKQLILSGEGFNVADTDEYMEGTGYQIPSAIAQSLHQGKYSIQDYIDLHGMHVEEAKREIDGFLKNSISSGKKSVLIIHGRGLSSPRKPVLKINVHKWLSTGYWKKWIIAFASARIYDGGAGGTYVLLRNRPVTKRTKN